MQFRYDISSGTCLSLLKNMDEDQDFKRRIKEIFNESDKEISSIKIESTEELAGEHLGSRCEFVNVYFKSGETIDLFAKRFIPKNESHTAIMREMNSFGKESGFYNVLLPEMSRYCLEKLGMDPISNHFPKAYFASEDLLILENLNTMGYSSIDKLKRQDCQQTELTLKILAKFHGISHCMIEKIGGKEEFEKKYPFTKEAMYIPSGRENFGGFMERTISAIIQSLKGSSIPGAEETYKELKEFDGKCFDLQMEVMQRRDHLFHVLNMGDLWTTNQKFIFDKGVPIHMKMYDLQCLRVNSPIPELAYYFYTSVQQSVLKESFFKLLQIYFEGFRKQVEELGRHLAFNFDDFICEFKRNAVYGLYYGIFSIGAMHFLPHFKLEESDNYVEDFSTASVQFIQSNEEVSELITRHVIDLAAHFKEFQLFPCK